MIYPETQEHSSSSEEKITTAAHKTRGQTHSRTARASSWLQVERKEESEATQAMSHMKYPLAIPQHS